MDIHYNAFISYRHHPEDIKVAEQIHRNLEHYRIPKAIQKGRNIKLRLFRDKEELPITSNLTDDITRALGNSDFLIVICSEHTKESVWVQREIETFLQTHDHSRVLTVLAGGEPYDTIPSILCSREETNPVTGQKTLLPIEPLSCDWRIDKRKAYREELPRLAAALLGCGYDELRQRERQYRTRRLVTIFSLALAASLALMSYVIYNSMQIRKANDQLSQANVEIQKNLEEAQINQSQYLANAATQQMEDGDRMLALSLALEALPKEEGARPYVTEAELALGQAVGAYMAESQVMAVGAITCDALVSYFQATDQREWMFVFDQRNELSVWNLETFRKEASAQLGTTVSKMLVTPGNNVLLQDSSDVIHCYDANCKLLWQAEDCWQMAFSQDREVLLTYSGDAMIRFWNPETGETVKEPVEVVLPEEIGMISFKQEYYDITRPVVLQYSMESAVCADLNTGEVTRLDTYGDDYYIRHTGTTAQGDLLVLVAGKEAYWNGDFGEMSTHSPVKLLLHCYTPGISEPKWTVMLDSYTCSDVHTLEPIPGSDYIFCQVDNVFAVIDASAGALVGSCQVGAVPVWTKVESTHATAILEDGSMGSYTYANNEFNSYRYFKDNLTQGFAGKGAYVIQWLSKQILVYDSLRDENWQQYAGEYDLTVNKTVSWGDLVAVYDNYGIFLFDGAAQEMRWYLEEPDGVNFQPVGFSQDGSALWVWTGSNQIAALDPATGEYTIYPLPEAIEDVLYYSGYDRVCMDGDNLIFRAEDLWSEDQYLLRFNTRTHNTEHLLLHKVEEDARGNARILAAWNGIVFAWEEKSQLLYKADFSTGEVKILRENVLTQPWVQILDDSGTYVISMDNRVDLYSVLDVELLSIPLVQVNGVSFCLRENVLLAIMDNGDLYRYDMAGNKLSQTGTELYQTYFTNVSSGYLPEDITWEWIGEDKLFLSLFRAGNLIDCSSWLRQAFIPQCITYLPQRDEFLTLAAEGGNTTLGAFKRYTLEDIRQMAQEALKGYMLTPEQKTQYGIS